MEQYTIELKLTLIAIIIVMLIIIFVLSMVWLLMKKLSPNKSKYIALLILVTFIAFLIVIIPMTLDVISETIFTANDVVYIRLPETYRRDDYNNPVTICFNDNTSKIFYLIADEDSYPYGEYRGSVVYTKYSRIILDFIPDT